MSFSKLPYFPCYKESITMDVRNLSIEAIGAYLLLMVEYFHCEGLPSNDETVRRLARMKGDKRWNAVRDELVPAVFTEKWQNDRWDKAIADMKSRSSTNSANGKRGAQARWSRELLSLETPDVDAPF